VKRTAVTGAPIGPGKRQRVFAGLIALLAWFVLGWTGDSMAAVDEALAQRYRTLAGSIDSRRLAATVRELSTRGSRVVGYPGERHAAGYVEAQFRALFGNENVQAEDFTATVPMDKGATLTAGGASSPCTRFGPIWCGLRSFPPKD